MEIDLQEQRAYLPAKWTSSSRVTHLEWTLRPSDQDAAHSRSLKRSAVTIRAFTGRLWIARERTVVADADVDMQVPSGGEFVPAPMPYFMRFHGADGMHAGYLPGYPASHGCVRMPDQYAIAFFNAVQVGTPVTVFGRTPVNRYYSGQTQPGFPRRPRFGPFMGPRFPASASCQCGGGKL